MSSKEIIIEIMNESGISQATLADRLGISTKTLWYRLFNKKNKDLNVSTLIEMLRALDYKLVIVPRNKQLADRDKEVRL